MKFALPNIQPNLFPVIVFIHVMNRLYPPRIFPAQVKNAGGYYLHMSQANQAVDKVDGIGQALVWYISVGHFFLMYCKNPDR